MPQQLRNLALVVRGAGPDEFYWTIKEADPGSTDYRNEVTAAQEPFHTYRAAMRVGYDALDTLAQEDPVRGPQVEIEPEAEPVIEPGIPMREIEYNGHRLVATVHRTPAGGYWPEVEVTSLAEEDASTPPFVAAFPDLKPDLLSPMVPFPRGGFAEVEEAFSQAFSFGEMAADGHVERMWFEWHEGGVEVGPKLRELHLEVYETAMLEFGWTITEAQQDHPDHQILVAQGRFQSASFIAALQEGAHGLLALGADNKKGPRSGDKYRPELCPDGMLVAETPRTESASLV